MTGSIDGRNYPTFGMTSVVDFYARATELQPAEHRIFDLYGDSVANAALLDLGVGGGRTTLHLAERAGRYVGVDYAPRMIAASKARFPGLEFVVADARRLPFEKGEFDVALFSHNGIDYVDSEGRDAILREVGRVLSRNGLFVFSTHNLLRSDFEVGHTGAWSRVRAKFRRWRLRRANPEWRSWQGATSAFINDGAFRQRLLTYHVRPSVQIAALEVAGFDDIRIFCGSSGTEVHRERSDELRSPWFYVSCRHGTSRPGPNPCGARLPRARAA